MTIEQPSAGRVLICGDWHGNTTWAVKVLFAAARSGYDTIIHVGDLKVLWPDQEGPDGYPFDNTLDQVLKANGQTLLFVDGNHDNHRALRALPVNDAGFGVITETLLYVPRGHRWSMGGLRFGGLGGAYSIDRFFGHEGDDWWLEEEVSQDDVVKLGSEPLDVLITHDVPQGTQVVSNALVSHKDELLSQASRLLISDAVRNTAPSQVFSGHWHQRVTSRLPYRETVVEVLDREYHPGNAVVLDLETRTVTPFDPIGLQLPGYAAHGKA